MIAAWLLAAVLASPELAAYRALARAPGGEALLAEARDAATAAAHGDADTLGATAAWPGPPRPVYVTLQQGRLTRACIGTDVPGASLSETVRTLAAQVLVADRRRAPVAIEELPGLRFVIAFAGEPEPVANPWSVDVAREGLKLESPRGAIAFLPGEARTVAWALAEARRVGVIAGAADDVRYSRFAVAVLREPPGNPPRKE